MGYTPFSYNYINNTQPQIDDKFTQSVLQDLAGINLTKQIPHNTLQSQPHNFLQPSKQNQTQAQQIDTSNGIKATQIQNQNQNATSLKDIPALSPQYDKNSNILTNQNQTQAQRYVGNGVDLQQYQSQNQNANTTTPSNTNPFAKNLLQSSTQNQSQVQSIDTSNGIKAMQIQNQQGLLDSTRGLNNPITESILNTKQDANANISNTTQEKQDNINALRAAKERASIDSYVDSSRHARINRAFGQDAREFEFHKLAMQNKHNLYNNYDENADIDYKELTKRHELLDKIVTSLETTKQRFGEKSKEYKTLLDRFQEYDVIKNNGIKDFKSLADFYARGGNVGAQGQDTKTHSNSNTTQDSLQDSNIQSIQDFMKQQRDFLDKEYNTDKEKNVFSAWGNNLLGKYDKGENTNNKAQRQKGLTLENGLKLLALDNLTKDIDTELNKHNATSKDIFSKDTKLQTYHDFLADKIESSNTKKAFNEFMNDLAQDKGAWQATKNIADMGVQVLKDISLWGVEKVGQGIGNFTGNIFTDKVNAKDNRNMLYGDMDDDIINMVSFMENALIADKKSEKLWEEKAKPALVAYLKEKSPLKKEKLKQEYELALQEVGNQWQQAPAKVLADSKLISLAQTMENQHDYGRFILNAFKDKNTKDSIRQEYLQDLHYILLQNKDFQDVEEVAYNKQSGQFLIKRNGNYEALESGFIDHILHGIHDTFNEISFSVAGAMYGGYKAAKLGKGAYKIPLGFGGVVIGGALGAGAGALIDEQINSWTTGYKNKDAGLKRASEAALLNIAGDFIIAGVAKTAKPLAKAVGKGIETTKDILQEPLEKSKELVSNGLGYAKDFVSGGNIANAKILIQQHLLHNSDRAIINKETQNEVFGHVLQEGAGLKDLYALLKNQGLEKKEALQQIQTFNKVYRQKLENLAEQRLQDKISGFAKYENVSFDSNRPLMTLMQDIFENKATREQRDIFLKFAMQDSELSNVVTKIAKQNPQLAKNLAGLIDSRSKEVKNALIFQDIQKGDFENLHKAYTKRVKHKYGEAEYAINTALRGKTFNGVAKEVIDTLENLKSEIPRVEHKGIINDLINYAKQKNDNIDSKELFELRKAVNEELRAKGLKKPSINALRYINTTIDNAIKQELHNIEAQSGIKASDIFSNYVKANEEYSILKNYENTDFYKNIKRDISQERFNKEIIKQAKRPKGFHNKAFEKIAKNTSPTLQAQAIREIIAKHTKSVRGREAIVWDKLIEDLATLQHSIVDSKLQEHIELLKDLQKFYHNDLAILQGIEQALGQTPNSYLATTFFGKVMQYIYNGLYRITGKYSTSEKAMNLGFENHINNALRYARSTKELNKTIIESLQPLDNDIGIKNILRELEHYQKDLESPAGKALEALITNTIDNTNNKKILQNSLQIFSQHKEDIQKAMREEVEIIEAEVIEDIPYITIRPKSDEEITQLLTRLQPEPLPEEITQEHFLTQGMQEIINKDNFIRHLENATDSHHRLQYLSLVEPTRTRPDFILDTTNKQGQLTQDFIKAFQTDNKDLFYVLITPRDNNNFLLTGIPTTKVREIKKRLKSAEKVKARDSRVVSSAQSPTKTLTPNNNDAIKELISRASALIQEIKSEALQSDKALSVQSQALHPEILQNGLFIESQLQKIIPQALPDYMPTFKRMAKELKGSLFTNKDIIISDSMGNNLVLNKEGLLAFIVESIKYQANKAITKNNRALEHTIPTQHTMTEIVKADAKNPLELSPMPIQYIQVDTQPIHTKLKALQHTTQNNYEDLKALQLSVYKYLDMLEDELQSLESKNTIPTTSQEKDFNTANLQTKETSDLLDTLKPLRKAKQEELTDELLQEAIAQDSKLYIDDAAPHIAQALGMDSAKITMRGSAMAHALKRHGADSNLVKQSGQEPIELRNIKTHNTIVNNADIQGVATDKNNQKVLISGKQVNGHYIVVESISTKDNELKFKTMYKEKGELENAEAFKNIERLLTPQKDDASIRLVQGPDTNLDSSHLSSADSTTNTAITQDKQSQALSKIKEKYNLLPLYDKQSTQEAITYKPLRTTIIQSESMKEPIHAEFAIINTNDLKPTFTSGQGYQFRNIKQDDKIANIKNNLRQDIVYQEGSFAGVPIIDKYGYIIAGNHRGEAFKDLSRQSRETLKKAIKDKFNYDLQDNEIVVRRVVDSHNRDTLIHAAKGSNDGLENRLSEAIYTKIAKYKDKLDTLPKQIPDDSMDSMQKSVNGLLGGNATSQAETHLALLTHRVPNPATFEKALNEIEKKGNDIKIQNMLLDNAGSFHNLNNAIPQVKIYDLLDGGVTILSHANHNTRNNIKGLNDRMRDYINTPKESLEYTEQILGNSPDSFKKIAFGYALNKISLQNTNPSEYVFTKIKSFMEEADELSQGNLFGEAKLVNEYDFIKHLLGNALDSTNQDFRKLFTQIEELEAKRNIEPLTNITMQAQTKEEAKQLTPILSNEIYNAKRDLLQLESQKAQGNESQLQRTTRETKNAIIETQTKDNKTIKTIVYNKKKDSLTINQHNQDNTITKLTQDNIDIAINTKDLHELLHTQDPFIAKIKKEMGKLENDYIPSLRGSETTEAIHKDRFTSISELLTQRTPRGEAYRKNNGELLYLSTDSTTTNPKMQETHTLENPSIEYALKESKDVSRQEIEELLSKGERGEVLTKDIDGHNFQKQQITYYKDTNKYKSEIGNYVDAEEGMNGVSFYLAKVEKIPDVIDPKHWERDLRALCEKIFEYQTTHTAKEANDFASKIVSKNPEMFKEHLGFYPKEVYKKRNEILVEYQKKFDEWKVKEPISLQTLNPQEIKAKIEQWNLSNPNHKDKIIISRVDGEELAQLQSEFNFKGNYPIVREIDAQHIAHALNRHAQDKNQANVKIDIDEILKHYPAITKDYDKRVLTNNNTIIYAKQINGHFIVIEEVLTGRNKLRFDTAWKQKGKLNEEVLFKNAKAFPNTEKQHKVATAIQNLNQIQGGTSHNQSLNKPNSTTNTQTLQTKDLENANNGLYHAGYDSGDRHRSSGHNSLSENKVDDRYAERRSDERFTDREKREAMGERGKAQTETGNRNADIEATKREVGARDSTTQKSTNLHDTQRGEIENLSIKDALKQREKAITDILFKEFEKPYTQDSLIDKFISKKAKWRRFSNEHNAFIQLFKENKELIEATKENVLKSKYFKTFQKKEQKPFLAEKEQKLQEAQEEAKRIIKLQEIIKDLTKDKTYSEIAENNTGLLDTIARISDDVEQTLHIKPLREFGMNYPQHYRDGQGAIARLLTEAKDYEARKEAGKLTESELAQGQYKGQVAGAFHKEGLGDIDLVWGEITDAKNHKGYGLSHIIDKHPEFDVYKIPEIIEKGEVVKRKGREEAYNIEYNGYKLGINKGFDKQGENKWIVTAFDDNRESAKTARADTLTKETDNLSLNSSGDSTTDNALLSKAQKKFKYDEKKARDLLEWHKDSSPITKDKDGLPKVFYHGSGDRFEVFNNDMSSFGYFFTPNKKYGESYKKNGGKLYQTFIKITRPFRANEIHINTKDDLEKIANIFSLPTPNEKIFADFQQTKEYYNNIVAKLKAHKATFIESDGQVILYELQGKVITDYLDAPMFLKTKEILGEKNGLRNYNGLSWFRNEFDIALSFIDTKKVFLEYSSAVGAKKLKNILKSKGYDGIKFNDFQYSVFDSNQIKHINNKGSYTDSSGNITSTKPKDTEAEHRYFNEQSPNIFYSNQHIGTGLASGTLAGVETDEQGNIIGFNPEKFALGFLGGAVGSKAVSTIYKSKTAQNYALKSIKFIQDNYKELSQQNPVLFAKILSNIKQRDFLNSKKEVKALSEEIFNKELKAKIQEAITKQEVELMPQSAFKNLDEFENLFDEIKGNKGVIQTPYKDVEVDVKYAFIHFKKNTYNTNRDNIKGGFFKTFKEPLFVVEQTREGSNKPSVYFYKPFYDENKKLLNLFGISVDNNGKLDFKTYYLDSNNRRLDILLNRKDLVIRYVKG